MAENVNSTQIRAKQWARKDKNGFEVSSAGDETGRLFSALVARYAPGTKLGDLDISNMTVEAVYQSIIKKSGKGLPPAPNSIVYSTLKHNEAEDYSYENGYLPLWSLWAKQNPSLIEKLRVESKGKTLTDQFALTRVSQARALADILNGNALEYTEEELLDFFHKPEKIILSEEAANAQVYTTGLFLRRGTVQNGVPDSKTLDELFASIPEGVTDIIDVRGKFSTKTPHLSKQSLKEACEKRGYTYTPMIELSDKVPSSNAEKYLVEGDEDRKDYRALSARREYIAGCTSIRRLVEQGRKVAIISSSANPAKDHRGLMVGKTLDAMGLNVYHQYGNEVIHQSEVIRRALHHRILDGGTYKDVSFASDGTYFLPKGVNILKGEEPSERRLINGKWNYGVPVNIEESKKAKTVSDAVVENIDKVDFNIIFTTDVKTQEVRNCMKATGGNDKQPGKDCTLIHLPNTKESLLDPDFIQRTAEYIRKELSDSLTYQWLDDSKNIDFDNVKLNIVGSDLYNITKYINVSDSYVTQGDLNQFMRQVLEQVTKEENSVIFNNDIEESRLFRIGEVITNGTTGIAEASNIACQSLNIKNSITAPKDFRINYDEFIPDIENNLEEDNVYKSIMVSDEAMFKNRFHQGLRNKLTHEELVKKLEYNEYLQKKMENGITPGLSDRQILILHNLGYSNNDLHEMIRVANDANISITTPEMLHTFIQQCDTIGGISGAEYITVDDVINKANYVDELIQRSHDKGIGFITVNNALYPKKLKELSYIKADLQSTLTTDLEGNAHVNTDSNKRKELCPAILWYRGDIENLTKDGISLVSEEFSTKEAQHNAREIGKRLAEEDMVVFTEVNPYNENSRNRSAASSGLYGAIENGGIAVGCTDEPLDSESIQDTEEQIMTNHGTMVSTHSIDEQNTSKDKNIGHRIGAVLSGTALVLDAYSQAQPTPTLAWLPSTVGLVLYATYRAGHSIKNAINNNSNDVPSSEKGLRELSENAKNIEVERAGRNLDEVLEQIYGKSPLEKESEEIDEQERDQFPEQARIRVVYHGRDIVYLVPKTYPDVREALRQQFGPNITIETPDKEREIIRKFNNGVIAIPDGREIQTFDGYDSAVQAQHTESTVDTIYYVDGKIYSITDAPRHTNGVIDQEQRQRNKMLFDHLVSETRQLQIEFQRAAGAHTDDPLYFDTALYPVIKDNSIEIRYGNEVRGVIQLRSDGSVSVENFDSRSDSLEEHARHSADIFDTTVKKNLDNVTVKSLLDNMKTALWEMDENVNRKYELATGDREAQNEIEQRLQNRFDTIPETNLQLATDAINSLPELKVNKKRIVMSQREGTSIAGASKTQAQLTAIINRNLQSLDEQIKITSESLQATEKHYEKIMYADNISEEELNLNKEKIDTYISELKSLYMRRAEYENIKDLIIKDTDSVKILTNKLGGVKLNVSGENAEIGGRVYLPDSAAHMRKVAKAVIEAESITEEVLIDTLHGEMDEDTIKICIHELQDLGLLMDKDDNGMITCRFKSADTVAKKIAAYSIKETEIKEALNEITYLRSGDSPVDMTIESKSEQAAAQESARQEESLKESAKADPSEIIGNPENGMYIIERDGRQAYADMELNIRSPFFANCSKPGKVLGVVTNADGEVNLFNFKKGELVSKNWYSKFFQSGEGYCCVARKDGMQNHMDLTTGELVSEDWSPSVRRFCNGWAVIQAGAGDGPENAGKFNYINKEGVLFAKHWLDRCGDFQRNGTAQVIFNGKMVVVDTKGTLLKHSVVFEESTGDYSQRTQENATASDVDYTVAFAVNPNSSGEKCTAKAAGNMFVMVEMTDCSEESVEKAARYLLSKIPSENGKHIRLNIAGNGIAKFNKKGISQDDVDQFIAKVLLKVKDQGVNIGFIRSGGQSGADEAGIYAARVLDIPAVVHAPKGYVYRDANDVNHSGKDEFIERFNKDLKIFSQTKELTPSSGMNPPGGGPK